MHWNLDEFEAKYVLLIKTTCMYFASKISLMNILVWIVFHSFHVEIIGNIVVLSSKKSFINGYAFKSRYFERRENRPANYLNLLIFIFVLV